MINSILLGVGFAFAAGVQPGPLQAFLLTRASVDGWRRTLPAALAPLLSDGPVALLVVFVLGRLPLTAQHSLRVIGGLFLLYLAWVAFRSLRNAGAASSAHGPKGSRTLLQAARSICSIPTPISAGRW